MRNIDVCGMNVCSSVVFNLMNVAVSIGVLDEVVNMARRVHIGCGRGKSGHVRGSWIFAFGESKLDAIAVWDC